MASLHFLSQASLTHLALTYGAWAVFVSVMLEGVGLPVPSESILFAVAMLAASGDQHGPAILTVILSASAGAMLGDNLGYALGRGTGRSILERFGPTIGLGPSRQRLGRYLFRRYGGRIVVVSRFVSVLRTAVSLLAGTTRMPWPLFLLCNALGAVAWACLVGGAAYLLGEQIRAWSWPILIGLVAFVAAALVLGIALLKREEASLQAAADRALPPKAAAAGNR